MCEVKCALRAIVKLLVVVVVVVFSIILLSMPYLPPDPTGEDFL